MVQKPATTTTGVYADEVGELANMRILPLAFSGHAYYVRKCKPPEKEKGIVIPKTAHMSESNNWAEVLGKGPKVGRPCSRHHLSKYRCVVGRELRAGHPDKHYLARCISDVAEVGDLLLVPNEDRRIKRSPLCDWEFFIEESLPYLIWPQEN